MFFLPSKPFANKWIFAIGLANVTLANSNPVCAVSSSLIFKHLIIGFIVNPYTKIVNKIITAVVKVTYPDLNSIMPHDLTRANAIPPLKPLIIKITYSLHDSYSPTFFLLKFKKNVWIIVPIVLATIVNIMFIKAKL